MAVPVLTRVGGRFAMHATGVGLVLLAHAPAEVQEEVLCAPPRPYSPKTVTDPVRLREMHADGAQPSALAPLVQAAARSISRELKP